jgi:hypothetical protein
MSNLPRALAQIEAIHDQLARAEIYRGWRSVPVAISGLFGLAAAAWQSAAAAPVEPVAFTAYWLVVGVIALVIRLLGKSSGTTAPRRPARSAIDRVRVLGQFLPALVAGAIATGALLRLSPGSRRSFPGLWAVLFGVACSRRVRTCHARADGSGCNYWPAAWRCCGAPTASTRCRRGWSAARLGSASCSLRWCCT